VLIVVSGTYSFPIPLADLTQVVRWNGTADNSWDAYYRASQAGLECIETDIRISSDGVLTMIHDSGLGRETNIGEFSGEAAYNPFTGQGYNPAVVETPYQGVIEHLRVRDETGRVHGEKIPTLPEMVQYIHDAETNVVLQLDVKDKNAVEYMYWQLKPLTNAAGIPANEWCIVSSPAWRTPLLIVAVQTPGSLVANPGGV
jgi:glycerophosphoryl diester phosphodiesterase